MLRYLLWRLRFEACNFRRLLGPGTRRVDYLAFGANLSDDVLRERRITPLAARPFTLRDYGLRFDHPAAWEGCAYASAEPAPGESLHGYLYTLSERDAARMDFYESVPILRRYRRTRVEQDGTELFFYQTNRSTPNLAPTAEYLGYILRGLASHPDVNADYLDAIRAIEPREPGALVSTFLQERPPGRSGWNGAAADAWERFCLRVYLGLLRPVSLTEPFVRS